MYNTNHDYTVTASSTECECGIFYWSKLSSESSSAAEFTPQTVRTSVEVYDSEQRKVQGVERNQLRCGRPLPFEEVPFSFFLSTSWSRLLSKGKKPMTTWKFIPFIRSFVFHFKEMAAKSAVKLLRSRFFGKALFFVFWFERKWDKGLEGSNVSENRQE